MTWREEVPLSCPGKGTKTPRFVKLERNTDSFTLRRCRMELAIVGRLCSPMVVGACTLTSENPTSTGCRSMASLFKERGSRYQGLGSRVRN